MDEPPDEPPRITPVPVIGDKELHNFAKRLRHKSTDESHCDPPATLIIRSFKVRSTAFVSHDEMSDISPVLTSYDEMATGGQEVELSDPPASDTEQGSESSLIRVQERSDDPELGACDPVIMVPPQKDNGKKSKCMNKFFALILFLVACAATSYLVVYVMDFIERRETTHVPLTGGENDAPSPTTFVGARPTTPMDPFEPGCGFESNYQYTQPHVLGQCTCNGEIKVMTNDVREKYNALKMLFVSMDISDVSELPVESCDPRNQALVWLATTYSKDRDDVMQKYSLASFFFQMTGEQWANREGWLVDEDHCRWAGVACDENGSITSIFLDGNGLKGAVRKISCLECPLSRV